MNAKNLSLEVITNCLEEAIKVGSLAANEKFKDIAEIKIPSEKVPNRCDSLLSIQVDRRSRFGRLIAHPDFERFRVQKDKRGGFSMSLPYKLETAPPVPEHELFINHAGDVAAAAFLGSSLGIKVYATTFDSGI